MSQRRELVRLVKDLRRARRSFLKVVEAIEPSSLDAILDESGWTARRLIGYCRATERAYFSRLFHFFNEEVEIRDSMDASLDHVAAEDPAQSLANECSQVWLAGRETEMWVDILVEEDLDQVRPASPEWPLGNWTIRGVFTKVANLYREKGRELAAI